MLGSLSGFYELTAHTSSLLEIVIYESCIIVYY